MQGQEQHQSKPEAGFTLVELLIAIVVVGVLTAVGILGVAGLTDKGQTSACQASMDAAKAASAVHFAKAGTYPQAFSDMTTATPPQFQVPDGVTQTGTTLQKGTHWKLTLFPHGVNTVTTYQCS